MPIKRKKPRQGLLPKNKCVTCNQPISAGARRCHECGSFQHWRYAILSAPGIAIIIATASLGVALYPLGRDALLSHSTVLDASLQAANLKALSILAQNQGGTPATFVQANLTVIDKDKDQGLTVLKPKNANPTQAEIVQPNSSVLIALTPIAQQGWAFAGSKSHCEMSFHFIDYNGIQIEKVKPVDCGKLTDYSLMLGVRYRALIGNAEASGGSPFIDGTPMVAVDDETITSLRVNAVHKVATPTH